MFHMDCTQAYSIMNNTSYTNQTIAPLSNVIGALHPISIATAPAPPVGLAFPDAYTAISAVTTKAKRPKTKQHHDMIL